MKSLHLSVLLFAAPLAPIAHAAAQPASFDEVQAQADVIDVQIDNTSGLTDDQLLAEMSAVLEAEPAMRGKIVNLTVGGASDRLDFSETLMKPMVETIGIKETLSPSQFARDVGSVVGSAVGGVHGSATVKVKVSETTKKGADGSSETSKTVDVSVQVTAGKK